MIMTKNKVKNSKFLCHLFFNFIEKYFVKNTNYYSKFINYIIKIKFYNFDEFYTFFIHIVIFS